MSLQVPEVPPTAADPAQPNTDAAATQQQQPHSILIQFCTS